MSQSKASGRTSPSPLTDGLDGQPNQDSASAAATDDVDAIDVSLVIPVFNERRNIPKLLDEIEETFARDELGGTGHEIIWIEDESTDGTSELLDDLALRSDHIRAIHLKRSYGQSAALAAGFDAASGEVIIPMDGDGQNDPADIPALLDKLSEGFDCVSGYRHPRNDPMSKVIPSRVQTYLAKFTGPSINDFGCTLKAYSSDAIDDISLYGEGHRYIPAKLYDKGYKITEVKVNHREREHGDSRYGLGRLARGFVDLLFHIFWVRFSTRPMHMLGTAGIAFMGAGGLIGMVSVLQKYAFGVELAPRTPRLMLTVLLITVGLQILVFGVITEMLTKLHYREEPEYRVQRVVR